MPHPVTLRRALGTLALLAVPFLAGGSAVLSSPPALPEGLVARWSFDGVNGDLAADAIDDEIACVLQGARPVSGRRGAALAFDGEHGARAVVVDALGSIPRRIAALSSGTVAVWLRLDPRDGDGEAPGTQPVLHVGADERGPVPGSVTIHVGAGDVDRPDGRNVYFTVIGRDGRPALSFATEASLEAGRWYHYAVTVAPDGQRVFLDGRAVPHRYLAGTGPEDGAFFASVSRAALDGMTVGYGGLLGAPYQSFRGAIDELHIYDRPLGPDEIAALAHVPST